jgi:hypothetical protein
LVAKDANCGGCHNSEGNGSVGEELLQRYADDNYHNIGTPFNPEIGLYTNNPELGADPGISGHTGGNPTGQQKTPTLRNVNKRPNEGFVKGYGHNGWFKSMEGIVRFYNTSEIGNCVIDMTIDPETGGPVEDCTGRGETAVSSTTAHQYGITRCADEAFDEEGNPTGYTTNGDMLTEAYALANNCWPSPAINRIIPRGGPGQGDGIGNLTLTLEEEAAIVAYMATLSDTKFVRKPSVIDLLIARRLK